VHPLPDAERVARLRAVPRPPKSLFLTLIALLLVFVPAVLLIRAGGVFRAVEYGFAGTCDAVQMPGIVRDIALDRERGIAYLSMLDADSGNGTVMLLDLNLANPTPRAAMSRDPQGFRPVGIALQKQPGQPTRLVAVSKAEGGVPTLEIAEQDTSGAFVPKETLRGLAIGNPDRIVTMSPNAFLLSDHREPRGGMQRKLGLLLQMGSDAIVQSDGRETRAAKKDLAWVSGLALSADGSHLYATELLKRRLNVFRIDAGEPVLERGIALVSAPTGITVDADGVIWMTAQPKMLKFFAALDGTGESVPTQVFQLDPRRPDAKPEQVFADDGAKISAGAAVARWRDELLIGARFDKKVLICKMPP
jgi:hypothetical protein